ncbi:MAG: hypothetical protein JWR50_3864 [Mucilaginibacter sp.]|nr:hypothetical protein [Mucilaginibacter sp.]
MLAIKFPCNGIITKAGCLNNLTYLLVQYSIKVN